MARDSEGLKKMWWWRKVRRADISQALRDELEMFGETVIAGAVTMTYNEPDHPEGVVLVRTSDAFTFTRSRLYELVSTHRKETTMEKTVSTSCELGSLVDGDEEVGLVADLTGLSPGFDFPVDGRS
jgi:hypothetical protein